MPLTERNDGFPARGDSPKGEGLVPAEIPKRPTNGFVSALHRDGVLHFAAQNGRRHDFEMSLPEDLSPEEVADRVVLPLIANLRQLDAGTHWRTIGIAGLNGLGRHVAAETWQRAGMSTLLFEDGGDDSNSLLDRVTEKHTAFGMRKIDIGPDGRVYSSRLGRMEDYRKFYKDSVWEEQIGIIDNVAKSCEDAIFIDANTTEKAGGVAGMNHPKQRIVEDRNHTEREKIASGQEGSPLNYLWKKQDGRIDAEIGAKYGIDLQDPELLEKFGEPDPENPQKSKINIFKLTKLRHVILQGDAEPEERYTEKYDKLYHAWSETQYKLNLRPVLMEAKAQGKKVALKSEDQQLWGQIPYIREDFPQDDPGSDFLRIIARNHIHSRAALAADPRSQQYPVAESILRDLSHGIDLFMVHRSNDQVGRDEFIFQGPEGKAHPVIADKIVYAEASFDEMDGLGRPVTEEEKPLLYAENNFNLHEYGQTPDDFTLPGIGIYARDDESKDKVTPMLGYALFTKWMLQDGVPLHMIPPYRDMAMGATDDPSGERINAAILIGLHPALAESIPQEIQDSFKGKDHKNIQKLQAAITEMPWVADKIKKYRFSYDKYDDRNRRSIEDTIEFGVQPSSSEACEDEISRKIANGTYTAIANVGGMPDQVEDGVSGKIIDKTGDEREIEAYAKEMYWYFKNIYPNPEGRAAFRTKVKAALKPQYTTMYNMAREFGAGALVLHHRDQLAGMIRRHREATGHYPFVHDLLGAYKPPEPTAEMFEKSALSEPGVVFNAEAA